MQIPFNKFCGHNIRISQSHTTVYQKQDIWHNKNSIAIQSRRSNSKVVTRLPLDWYIYSKWFPKIHVYYGAFKANIQILKVLHVYCWITRPSILKNINAYIEWLIIKTFPSSKYTIIIDTSNIFTRTMYCSTAILKNNIKKSWVWKA